MPQNRRLLVALLVALAAAAYVLVTPWLYPAYASDFDQLWIAARAWLAGENPYTVIQHLFAAQGHTYGLLYPGGAVVMATPFALLPLPLARALFAAITAGTFSYLLLARGWWLYPILLSASMRSAVSSGQIAPLIAASILVPAFGFIALYKPNVAIPALFAQRSQRAVNIYLFSALALTCLTFALWPTWPRDWMDAVKTGTANRPLVLQPGGVLLLLALVRWREPEARWLAVMCLIPVNPKTYDALPLLVLLPRNHKQALTLALLSHVAELAGYAFQASQPDWSSISQVHARALLYLLYLPALGWMLWLRRDRQAR